MSAPDETLAAGAPLPGERGRWRTWLLNIAVIVATMAVLSGMRWRQSAPPPPTLVITPAIRDLGSWRSTPDPRETSFTIQNTSQKSILLTQISASCGCTTAGVEQQTALAPGESRALKARFVLGDRVGEVRSTIFVEGTASDGAKFQASGIIRAQGIVAASREPKVVRLGTLECGHASNHARLRLIRGEAPVLWDGVEWVSRALEIKVLRQTPAFVELDLSLKEPSNVIGAAAEDLAVYLTHAGQRLPEEKMVVPVSWEISHPAISVQPSMAYLGVVPKNGTSAGVVVITSAIGTKLTGVDCSTAPESAGGSVRPGASDNVLRSSYRINAGEKEGTLSLLMQTKILLDGAPYVVKTPIVGFVR